MSVYGHYQDRCIQYPWLERDYLIKVCWWSGRRNVLTQFQMGWIWRIGSDFFGWI